MAILRAIHYYTSSATHIFTPSFHRKSFLQDLLSTQVHSRYPRSPYYYIHLVYAPTAKINRTANETDASSHDARYQPNSLTSITAAIRLQNMSEILNFHNKV